MPFTYDAEQAERYVKQERPNARCVPGDSALCGVHRDKPHWIVEDGHEALSYMPGGWLGKSMAWIKAREYLRARAEGKPATQAEHEALKNSGTPT